MSTPTLTTPTLDGKPDAGKPHVRLDEGKVASAKPRRGSLLYTRRILAVGFVLMLSFCCTAAGAMKITSKGTGGGIVGSGGFTANRWEEFTLQFGEGCTEVYLNGSPIFTHVVNLAGYFADCSTAGGYFVIAGDDDGDDNVCYWADVKVYDGIVD